MRERWKVIPGYDEYEASTLGGIRRINRSGSQPRWHAGHLLHSTILKSGYAMIGLGCKTRRKYLRRSRIVLRTFAGQAPSPIHQANHKNGKKSDDRLENLEWVTPKANVRHACKLFGPWHNRGNEHHNAKLTTAKVIEAKLLVAQGMTHCAIATKFSVSRPTITAAVSGRNWNHVS